MRTFDYRHLPHNLFEGSVGDANVKVYEDRGKLEALKITHADALAALRASAHFDNVDASTRVEGLYVGAERTRELLAEATAARAAGASGAGVAGAPGANAGNATAVPHPADETEAQIIGYSNALALVEDRADELELDTATILAFYETLYAHRNLGRKSRYRKKDYMYVQVDGHMEALPVSPITAFETPLVLGGACDSLAEAFSADACSPLVLNAVFTVDFLCIRPFEEGNGRISRLFSDLMLMKAGFDVARYVSIDRIIESAGMDYYNALNSCVEGWDRSRNDYTPYALYWLGIVHEAYQQLFARLERIDGAGGSGGAGRTGHGKSERVRAFVLQAGEPLPKRRILEAFPDISEATVENVLGKMVKAGELEKVGAGRSTAYVAKWQANTPRDTCPTRKLAN